MATVASKFPSMIKYAAMIVIAVGLYVARDICIPVALAALLCFLLSPVVSRLQKWHIHRIPAVIIVMLVFCTTLLVGGWLIVGQLVQMVDRLPQFQETVHEKMLSLHIKPGGTLDRLNRTFDSYAREMESIASQPAPTQPSSTQVVIPATEPQAIEVTLAPQRATGVQMLRTIVFSALKPIITLGLVLILTLFMLIQREDLRDRAIRLMGGSQLHTTTEALDDAGQRVSRYLLFQLVVNVCFGVLVWLGLLLIGIPYSGLWGAVAGIMRFMPYFGVPAAALPPLVIALVTLPGFMPIVLTISLFVALEIVIAYFIEPWLYGAKTGITPLAILVSALFWAWIWGAAGLLLSTPLTVCLAVIGRHIPGLRFLQVLFGDEPPLKPEARLYQRLLAGDLEEAEEMSEAKIKATSLGECYDTLLVPALVLAEHNRHRGELDETRAQGVLAGMGNLIDDLQEQDAARRKLSVREGSNEVPLHAGERSLVICMGANDEADGLAARMLAGILRGRGVDARVTSAATLSGESVSLVSELQPDLVCISAVPPHAVMQARYLCKRLRAAHPQLKIVAGLWQSTEPEVRIHERLAAPLADYVVTRLQDAADRIVSQSALEARLSTAGAKQ